MITSAQVEKGLFQQERQTPEQWMREALFEAEQARQAGEVPVGAVVVLGDEIIGRGYNQTEQRQDAGAHAEILALREASKHLGNWRLKDCSLVVTLEPCVMCMGAAILARLTSIYFGCYDKNLGAAGSLFNLSQLSTLPHQLEVYPEVLNKEAQELLGGFFQERRHQSA